MKRKLISVVLSIELALLPGCSSAAKKPVDYAGPEGRDAVKAVVTENLEQVQRCYASRLEREENFQCRLTYTIEIDGKGRASAVQLKGANGCKASSPIVSCIKNAIASWQFHPPADGEAIEVNYPFVLRKQPSDRIPAAMPVAPTAPAPPTEEPAVEL